MELDPEDYELLGWGSARLNEEYAAACSKRAESVRATQRRYGKSLKGKAARDRRKEARREYDRRRYKENAEALKAKASAYYHLKVKTDPARLAKSRAQSNERAKRYYHRKKAEREQARRFREGVEGAGGVVRGGGG